MFVQPHPCLPSIDTITSISNLWTESIAHLCSDVLADPHWLKQVVAEIWQLRLRILSPQPSGEGWRLWWHGECLGPRGNLNTAIMYNNYMDTESITSRHFTDRQTDYTSNEWIEMEMCPYKADHHIHCLVWNNIEKVGLDTDTERGGGGLT